MKGLMSLVFKESKWYKWRHMLLSSLVLFSTGIACAFFFYAHNPTAFGQQAENPDAIQSCTPKAVGLATPRIASFDSKRGALANALVGTLLNSSVELTVIDWNSIAETDVSLLQYLTNLKAYANVASTTEALTTEVELRDVLQAAADAAEAENNSTAAIALNSLSEQIPGPSRPITLGDFLEVDIPNTDEYALMNVNLLDIVMGSISLFNYDHMLSTPNPITLRGETLGLDQTFEEVSLQAQIIEPPVMVIGKDGAMFHSAHIRTLSSYRLNEVAVPFSSESLLGIQTAHVKLSNFNMYNEITRVEGTIDTIDSIGKLITVSAHPGLVDTYIGEIAPELFWNREREIGDEDVDYGVIGGLTLTFDQDSVLNEAVQHTHEIPGLINAILAEDPELHDEIDDFLDGVDSIIPTDVNGDGDSIIDEIKDLIDGLLGSGLLTISSHNDTVSIAQNPGTQKTYNIELKTHFKGEQPLAEVMLFGTVFPETQTVTSSTSFINTIVSNLLENSNIRIGTDEVVVVLNNENLLLLIDQIWVNALRDPLYEIETLFLDPLLKTLGIGIGEADITIDLMQGKSCKKDKPNPPPEPPKKLDPQLSIQLNEEKCSSSREVTAFLSAKDADEYIISLNKEFTGASWKSMNGLDSITETLILPSDGEFKVYAQFRNSEALSDIASAPVKVDSQKRCHEAPIKCPIDCDLVDYTLYIINPDGSRRSMGTEYAKVEPIGPNRVSVLFEDKAEDFDYNDVRIEVDTSECNAIIVETKEVNAVWHHRVYIDVRYQDLIQKTVLVAEDSHSPDTAKVTLPELNKVLNICLEEKDDILEDDKYDDELNENGEKQISRRLENKLLIPGDVFKGENSDTVYYYGLDEKRYTILSTTQYFSWFSDFDPVLNYTNLVVQSVPFGGIAATKPGETLYIMETGNEVYAIDHGRVLRWIGSESIAYDIYGDNWNQRVRVLPDAFVSHYTFGEPILSATDYDRFGLRDKYDTLDKELELSPPANTDNQ